MRALTGKDEVLLSHFDKNDETQNGSNDNSLKEMLIDNHSEANRGKIKGQHPLEHIFGFYKTCKKITKNLGFHLTYRTNDLQDIIFTTLGVDINVTINSLYPFVPTLFPNTETQVLFNESIKNIYIIKYDSSYAERKLSTDVNDFKSILVVLNILTVLSI